MSTGLMLSPGACWPKPARMLQTTRHRVACFSSASTIVTQATHSAQLWHNSGEATLSSISSDSMQATQDLLLHMANLRPEQLTLDALPAQQLSHAEAISHIPAQLDNIPQLVQQLYTLAEAAAGNALPAASSQVSQRQDAGWLTPIANALEYLLSNIQDGLNQLHVPYSYGWSIILLTLFTKVLTFPFTKVQVESAISTQKLKPIIDDIKRRYEGDKDKIQRETSDLYEKSGVNPLAGCLPTLATIPIFWGLYRTLSNVASDGLLTEGFYWIPSLSGPITIAQQRAGGGISWLLPFVDGQPPIGWDAASRYLVLPVLLVGCQFLSTAIISPPVQPDQEDNRTQKILTTFLPFMIGWFALNLPAGLSLYYFSNITLTSAIQIWLRKLGGAKAFEWKQEIGLNQARRTGQAAALSHGLTLQSAQDEGTAIHKAITTQTTTDLQVEQRRKSQPELPVAPPRDDKMAALLQRRCKRKKRALVENAA